MSFDGSARKRARQASDYPETSSLQSPWECHPVYGIVHPTGCNICHPYMSHMAEAERQPSFQHAVKDRDHKRDVYFFDGVSEGRRRQRDDDEYLFDERERYRAERNEAREALSRYRSEAYDTREELRLVLEQLSHAQTECDRLRQQVEPLSGDMADRANLAMATTMEGLEVERMLLYDAQFSSPQVPISRILDGQVTLEPSAPQSSSNSAAEPHVHYSSSSTPSTYAAVASSQPAEKAGATTVLSASTSGHQSVNLPARPGPPPPSYSSVDLRAAPVQITPPIFTTTWRNPKNIRQLQSLMTAAHQPGNDGALAKVKALCAEAHQTPREQKTDLQRFLLSNWRNPAPAGDSTVPPPPLRLPPQPAARINPRMDDPVEAWYDYLSAHQGSWPRGVRRDTRNRPHLPDLRASRTVARLRPEVDATGSITSRSEFMSRVAELFSVPGTYQEYIGRLGLTIASSVLFVPFNGHGSPTITTEDVVAHFARCGVTTTAASQELEPWAQCYQAATPAAVTALHADSRNNGSGRSPTNGQPAYFGGVLNGFRSRQKDD